MDGALPIMLDPEIYAETVAKATRMWEGEFIGNFNPDLFRRALLDATRRLDAAAREQEAAVRRAMDDAALAVRGTTTKDAALAALAEQRENFELRARTDERRA